MLKLYKDVPLTASQQHELNLRIASAEYCNSDPHTTSADIRYFERKDLVDSIRLGTYEEFKIMRQVFNPRGLLNWHRDYRMRKGDL